ncbi:hypothetical protein ACQKGO_35535 [Corallococcus interemptor]|uniref:hypothetical protein n=1 Tax=Corallococcus interemptor TaxID=2316720 RepID=UPI003CFF9F3F
MHARTGSGADRTQAAYTLWQLNQARFLLAFMKTLGPLILLGAVVITLLMSWPRFSVWAFMTGLFLSGLLIGMVGILYLIFKVDARGSTYCKDPVMELAPSEDDLTARDASGALLGRLTDGTLRVVRVNLMRGKQGLAGALRVDHAKGSVWLSPYQWIGAWPGLRADSAHEPVHLVEDPLFDALMRLAE